MYEARNSPERVVLEIAGRGCSVDEYVHLFQNITELFLF